MRKPFEHDPEAFSKALQDSGLTMTAVAAELGCSKSLISEIAGGTRNARRPLLERAAELFDVPVSELERRDEPAGTPTSPADVDMSNLQRAERTVAEDLPECVAAPCAQRSA